MNILVIKKVKHSILERIHSEMRAAVFGAVCLKKVERGASVIYDLILSQSVTAQRKALYGTVNQRMSFVWNQYENGQEEDQMC